MLSEYSFIYSFFIYGMTMISMIIVAIPFYNTFPNNRDSAYKQSNKMLAIVLMSLIFGLVFGMRWDVGTDNLEYLRIYIHNDTEWYKNEYIFKWINDSLYSLGIHYWMYFALFAFVQVFLLFYALKNEAYLWAFLILSLFGGHFFVDWMNGMRQEMASCIMLVATNFIIKRQPIKYLLFILIAAGFHSSALLFLVVYPLMVNGKQLVPSWKIQLFLLIMCSGITIVIGDILSKVFPILEVLQQVEAMNKYTATYNEDVLQRFSDVTHIGIMFYIFLIVNSIIIVYSDKIKIYFGGRRINIYYNLFYWGMLFETLLATNMVLVRPFRYFRIYKLIMIAYLLYYLYKHPSTFSTLVFIIIIGLLLAGIVIKAITTPFNFYFEIPYAP